MTMCRPADFPPYQEITMTATTNDVDQARILLDQAREHYEAFQEAMQGLGWIIQDLDEWMYHRVDAYPGWHGTRDMGSGQDMLGWLDEIDRYLEATDVLDMVEHARDETDA